MADDDRSNWEIVLERNGSAMSGTTWTGVMRRGDGRLVLEYHSATPAGGAGQVSTYLLRDGVSADDAMGVFGRPGGQFSDLCSES